MWEPTLWSTLSYSPTLIAVECWYKKNWELSRLENLVEVLSKQEIIFLLCAIKSFALKWRDKTIYRDRIMTGAWQNYILLGLINEVKLRVRRNWSLYLCFIFSWQGNKIIILSHTLCDCTQILHRQWSQLTYSVMVWWSSVYIFLSVSPSVCLFTGLTP